MHKQSPAKILRNVIRITKFLERKRNPPKPANLSTPVPSEPELSLSCSTETCGLPEQDNPLPTHVPFQTTPVQPFDQVHLATIPVQPATHLPRRPTEHPRQHTAHPLEPRDLNQQPADPPQSLTDLSELPAQQPPDGNVLTQKEFFEIMKEFQNETLNQLKNETLNHIKESFQNIF